MAPPAEDRCGLRHRRGRLERKHSTIAKGDKLQLAPRGRALLEAIREDPRYRDLIADPFVDRRD